MLGGRCSDGMNFLHCAAVEGFFFFFFFFFLYSFIHLLIYSFIHLFIYSFIHLFLLPIFIISFSKH